MNNLPFQVSIDDIKALDEKYAVIIFKHILQAEAYKHNLPITKLQISENIHAADGGIDGIIHCLNHYDKEIDDFLKNGSVIYQIKADNSFSNFPEMTVINELLTKVLKKDEFDNITDDELKAIVKPKLKELIEKGGYYVLVSFRSDSFGNKKQDAINLIKSVFKRIGYENPKIDIFDCTNLQTAINQYLPIVSMIKPFPDCIDTVTNILREKSFNNEFYKNEKIIEIEKTFEDFLENKTDIKHIRVLAEPGTGKTKAVLEFCKAYNSNVLYVESAEKFDDSQLYSYLKKLNYTQITLIIDECNLNNAKTFMDRLTYKLKNLKLITIYNDFNTNTADTETKIIEYPKLTNEDFTKILTDNYGMRKADASHIASFCDGYPRLAHYIGHNFIANKKVLENLEDVMKGIVLSSITDENEQKNILAILRYLSVFKKFGCSEHNSDEKQCIFELIKYELPNLTKIDFDRIINYLKSQKILQQEYTLYISPKILHIWFFGEFWKNESRKNHLLVNVENMPEQLQMWFSEMFTYARNAEISVDIPKELLSQFDLSALKSKKKSDFFVNLTKANQKEALNVLLKIFDNLPDEEIKNFTDTRMNLVWALQYILFDKDLFNRGIKLLYRFAVNETEHVYSNNATGIFRQFFHIFLPGTEATLETRGNLLKELYLNAKNKEEIKLLIKTFSSALETRHFMRFGGVEIQGFTQKQDYKPDTYDEICDYYNIIIDLLIDCISNNNQEAVNVLFSHTLPLIRYHQKSRDLIIEKIEELYKSKKIDGIKFYKEICNKLKHMHNINEGIMKPAINNFSKIKNELEKTTPEDSIEAFFDINSWDVLENFDNHFEAFVNVILKAYNNFYESADEEKKQNFIKLCIQKKYKNDFYFGTAIAKSDNLDFLPDDYITYVKNSDNEDGLFIPGYLNEIYKKSNENYDKAIQKIYDLELYELVFNINVQGYKTDLSTKLLLDVITTGKVQADKMQKLVWDIDRIPENIIKELLEFSLKGENHSAIKASLNILMHSKTLWKEENINLIYNILSKIVYKEQGKVYANISDDYIWANVISKFIKTCNNEEQIFNIFDELLDYITSKSDYYLSNEIREVFSLTAKRNSHRSWELISKCLTPDKIFFSPICEWLRGDDGFGHNVSGAMSEYNPDDIYKWIDENIDERLSIIARCCPKDLFIGGNVIKSLLIRYGSNENLYRYLHFNYASKGWIGKESDYIKNELALAEKTKDNEKNIYVLNFINQYIDNLNVDLNRAERYEERYD